MARVTSFPGYKRLSPSELRARGLRPKSEQYLELSTGNVISKRRYQERKLLAATGARVTLEQRARNFAKRVWTYLTRGQQTAARARTEQAAQLKATRTEALAAAVPTTRLTKTDQALLIESAARQGSVTARQRAALHKLFKKSEPVDAKSIYDYVYRNKPRLKKAA